jgi:hypothetical protein
VSKKIAPNLTQMVAFAEKLGLGYWPKKSRAELRALLAAVRAGDRFFWHAVQGDPCCVEDSCGEGARYRRAKARLDRASKGGKP